MSNASNVQKYLKFLYNCSIGDKSIIYQPLNESQGHFFEDGDCSYFDYKEIYDTLSNFAFLTLMNNSHIEIDQNTLNEMVYDGDFTRVVTPTTFEGGIIDNLLKNGKKTKDGVVIVDQFGQEHLVNTKNKKYVVQTKCYPVEDYDWLKQKRVRSNNIVNIIRNGMIHGTSTDMLQEKDTFYQGFLENTEGQQSYAFRSGNECVVILATENWIREFKKVFFLDSYCFVDEKTNEFNFPRFMPVLDKNISDENDLEFLLKNAINTKITIKDSHKNFMEARMFIEDTLFEKVLSKDIQLKYGLKNKTGQDRIDFLQKNEEQVRELITTALKNKGYNDFEIEFSPIANSKNFDEIMNIWKVKLTQFENFYYGDVKLKDQLTMFSRINTLIPSGGFKTKENYEYGITPQMVSLFLSTVELSKLDLNYDDKFRALDDLEKEGKITPLMDTRIKNVLMLNNKSNKKGFQVTNDNIDAIYKVIANSVDESRYQRVSTYNCFHQYCASHEFAFMTAYASIYNGLIETGFYEKACAVNKETGKYPVVSGQTLAGIKYLDLSEFKLLNANDQLISVGFPNEKLLVLSTLRNALVHGGGRINYDTITKDVSETEITFFVKDGKFKIVTTVDAIIKLFDNRVFYQDVEVHVKKNKG